MAFYASGTSVQSPVRAESAAASTACGFRPSSMDGREAFAARCAAGERNRSGGIARTRRARGIREVARYTRSIPRTMRTTSSRLRRTDAKPFRASCSRGRESKRGNRPERAGHEEYVRLHDTPIQPTEQCAQFRTVFDGRTRSLCRASRSRGRESSQWNCPERAGREWCAASVQSPGRRARLAASGRSQWTDAKTFREPRSRESEGYARRCFTSPAHPSSCPCGRNPRRRMRFAASGRHQWTDAEPYRASRSRERESSQWNRPERAGRGWYVKRCAASVRLPGRGAQLAASGRL